MSNPALNEKSFNRARRDIFTDGMSMTIEGTINKSLILLTIVLVAALYTWRQYFSDPTSNEVKTLILLGIFGGFGIALLTIFKETLSPYTAPIYAVLEGLALGGISAFMESKYPGIAIQSVGLTFGVCFLMLFIYKTEIIKVTEGFIVGVIAATGAICIVYIITILLGMFGVKVPFIHQGGWVGILFSLAVVTVAALNLIIDFDFIYKNVTYRVPKYMEWYSAFSLMVTLIWLYLEVLRLIAKLRGDD